MRESTVVYRSFYEATKDLPKKNQGEIWAAICELAFNFKEPELKGISKIIFTLIRPQIEANIRKYENGKKAKKKQADSKPQASDEQTENKPAANANDNVTENENKNENDTLSVNVNANTTAPKGGKTNKRVEKNIIELKEAEEWLKEIARVKNTHPFQIHKHLHAFIDEMRLRNELDKDIGLVKKHFYNWLTIQFDKNPPLKMHKPRGQ